MTTISPYKKASENLKEIKRIQDTLISKGLAHPEDKQIAFDLAQETAKLFTDDILKRKVEKLKNPSSPLKNYIVIGGFVSSVVAEQLKPWIVLIEEFIESKKVKTDISNETTHIHSQVDGENQHLFISEKGSDRHAHIIVDHRGNRELLRIDGADQDPGELIASVEATIVLKNGETINVTKNSMNFGEKKGPIPDVRAYKATKDSYNVVEIYNCGDEDLEEFKVIAYWEQPEGKQERVLDDFNDDHDDMRHDYPKKLNLLKKENRIYSHLPSLSIDGQIIVKVFCKGIKTGTSLEKEFALNVGTY